MSRSIGRDINILSSGDYQNQKKKTSLFCNLSQQPTNEQGQSSYNNSVEFFNTLCPNTSSNFNLFTKSQFVATSQFGFCFRLDVKQYEYLLSNNIPTNVDFSLPIVPTYKDCIINNITFNCIFNLLSSNTESGIYSLATYNAFARKNLNDPNYNLILTPGYYVTFISLQLGQGSQSFGNALANYTLPITFVP